MSHIPASVTRSTTTAAGPTAILVLLLAVAGSARAELARQWVPVRIIASGGFCDHPPDEYVRAPDAEGGRYEHNFSEFDYVVRGDSFPAQIGLGIGVRSRIEGYGPGRVVRVRVQPPNGRAGSWEMPVGQDGELEFGRLPATGKALEEGRYYLSVLDEGRKLFTFAISLEGDAEASLCVPVS
jgi:hypothetical protein